MDALPIRIPALVDVTGDGVPDDFIVRCVNGSSVAEVCPKGIVSPRDAVNALAGMAQAGICVYVEPQSVGGDDLVIEGDLNGDGVDDVLRIGFEDVVPVKISRMSDLVMPEWSLQENPPLQDEPVFEIATGRYQTTPVETIITF
jgi:hypothetical protein